MKLFLIGLAIKVTIITVLLAVGLFFLNKEIDKRADDRADILLHIAKIKEDREWKRLTRREVADLRLSNPRDGVNRDHGWHWQTHDHEYRLVRGLLDNVRGTGDITSDTEFEYLTLPDAQ